MMRNKPILIFQDAHTNIQFYRDSRLSLAYPFSVLFENGEGFFAMGDNLSLQYTPVNLVDSTHCMLDIVRYFLYLKYLA